VNKNTRSISGPSKSGAHGENATYPKLEKPRFLFLEGLADAAVAPVAAAAALPDASAARAASTTDRPAAGPFAPPQAPAPLPPLRLLVRGARDSSSPDDEFSGVAGGESPCCSRSRYSLSRCSRRSHRRILFSFLRVARSCSRLLHDASGRSGLGRGRVGPRGVHSHPLLKGDCQNHAGTLQGNEKGSITNDQRSSLSCLSALRLMARLVLVAA
jgi:hypothetical protein